MNWTRISPLLLFTFLGQSIAEDLRSFRMSTMNGWQFQCVYTTCIPFVTLTMPNIRRCQMMCLAQIHCEAVSFHRSTSTCQLFADISYQNGYMLADLDTVSMIVLAGTRIPPGLYQY